MGSLPLGDCPQDIITSNYLRDQKTYVVSLEEHDLEDLKNVLERISYGADVWELRADLLTPDSHPETVTNLPPLKYVAAQLDILQQNSRLPILFTIRTISQGGKFPDEAAQYALSLMLLAIDKGCAFVDVQGSWPEFLRDEVDKRKQSTRIVASYSDPSGVVRWSDSALREQHAVLDTFGDTIRISLLASASADDPDAAAFVRYHHSNSKAPKAIITNLAHAEKQTSCVTSAVSFVGHPLLPKAASSGLGSMADENRRMYFRGEIPRLEFFIIGNNISHSLSPTIHNTAFSELGLPHHYSIFETPATDASVFKLVQNANFGGGSVTFPHKLSIQPLLDSISDSSQKIGAVNTIVVENGPCGRKLRGENTDWLGILRCIRRKASWQPKTGLVIGAGGAARAAVYAMQNLGLKSVAIVNRTKSTAEKLAVQFPALNISIHETLATAQTAELIIGCIPADDVTEADIPSHIFAPEGLVIEMSYRPPVSALMKVARRHPHWMVMDGVDVLKEQAYSQFQLWLGREAPVSVIEEALAKRTRSKTQ